MAATAFSVDDLWNSAPGASLPAGAVLKAIAERFGRAWDMPNLAARARIGYSARLRTSLGRAILEDGRVELNTRLLLQHPDQLVPTLAHELAHLVVFWRYGRVAPHGIQFRALMRVIGLSAEATHDLPVGGLKRRRRRFLYLHRCTNCGQTFTARRIYRGYYCTDCGPRSSWEILRVPDTARGRKLLQAAAK